jgi:hypothetical protein
MGYVSVCCRTGEAKPERHAGLVARQFVSNPDNLPYVNHINRCKHDNHISNLSWCKSPVTNRSFKKKTAKGVPQTYYDSLPAGAVLITNERLKPNTFYKTSIIGDLGGASDFLEYCNDGINTGYRVISELKGRSKGYYFKNIHGKQLWISSNYAKGL